VTILTEENELTCENLLPGFRLPLSEIFKKPVYVESEKREE
jgi:hypothetical protein